jgi:hypothetical protein
VLGKGDLMLRPSCDIERCRLFDEVRAAKYSNSVATDPAPSSGNESTITAPSLVGVDYCVKRGSIGLITPGDICINKLMSYNAFYRDRWNAEYLHKTVGRVSTADGIA